MQSKVLIVTREPRGRDEEAVDAECAHRDSYMQHYLWALQIRLRYETSGDFPVFAHAWLLGRLVASR